MKERPIIFQGFSYYGCCGMAKSWNDRVMPQQPKPNTRLRFLEKKRCKKVMTLVKDAVASG